MGVLVNENGLDLDFSETKKLLNIPVKDKGCQRRKHPADPMFSEDF